MDPIISSSPSFPPHPPGFPGLGGSPSPEWQHTFKVAKDAIDKFESTIWKYTKETAKCAKSMAKVTILTNSRVSEKIGKVIIYLGLLSGIKLLFQSKSFLANIDKLIECIKLKELEGIAWSSVEMLFSPLEVFHSLLSFTETLSKLNIIPWIELFSIVTLPLSIVLLCYDTIKSMFKLFYLGLNFGSMPRTVTEKNLPAIKAYLDKKVGVDAKERKKIEERVHKKLGIDKTPIMPETEGLTLCDPDNYSKIPQAISEGAPHQAPPTDILSKKIQGKIHKEVKLLEDRKANKLERQVGKVVNVMKNLKQRLEKHPEDVETAKKAMGDMRKLMIRKIILGSIETTFHWAECVMAIFLMTLPINIWIPVTLSVSKSFVSLGKTGYNDVMMKRDLQLPEYIKA